MGEGRAGRNVLLGVGNEQMGDDAAGVTVGIRVSEMDQENDWVVFNCGMDPEHYTRDVKKCEPDVVVIVDAADMALPPGEIRIIGNATQNTIFLTTHRIPLSSFVEYIESFVPTCYFIGIQPEFIGPRSSMSPKVDHAVTELSRILSASEFDRIEIME